MKDVLTAFGTLASTIIGIALIAFIIVQGFALVKGKEGGSIGKLISGIAGFIVLLVIIGFAVSTGDSNPFSEVGKKAVTVVEQEGTNLVGK